MSYAQENLRPGERIVLETHLSLAPVIISAVWSWLFLFIPTLIAFLRFRNTEFVVTTKRVIVKRGVLSTTSDETSLDRVQNISFRQGILGKIFDYGTVTTQTGATFGADRIRFVKSPPILRDTISRQSDVYRTEQIQEQAQAIARGLQQQTS